MSERRMTCGELDALLPGYMEGELGGANREAVDEHVRNCVRCTSLLAELSAVSREARALPNLVPSRDLWPEIEARIQAPVVSLDAERVAAERIATERVAAREAPQRWSGVRLVAAAAALVVTTAGITYVATTRALPERASVAAARGAPASETLASESLVPESLAAESLASKSLTPAERARSARPTALPASVARTTRPLLAAQIYDQEITRLQTIVRDRGAVLDTATVAVIRKNLGIIDSAIAQSRAALSRDPGSRFLNDQLNSVLDQKVELLRTVALLPART